MGDETRSDLFPPETWVVEPLTRRGIPRDALGPCSCGDAVFLLIWNPGHPGRNPTFCRSCYANPRFRMAARGDVEYGWLDARTGEITVTKRVGPLLQREREE